MAQKCPLCGRRRGRRTCPALNQSICAVCCGSKRLTEINCPPDCAYLLSSQAHPPAVVQRQRERDLGFLVPFLHGMTERQHHVMLLVQGLLRRDRPDAPAMTDADVVQATQALAETFETASRGIIYEHTASIPSAERLAAEIKGLVEAERAKGLRIGDGDIAHVMRRIESAARDAHGALPGDEQAYLDLLKRVMRDAPADGNTQGEGASSGETGLIVPGA